MSTHTILIVLVSLLLGGVSGYGIAQKDTWHNLHRGSQTQHDSVPTGMHRMPDGSLMGDSDADMEHMNHMMDMMVESERAFIEGMIPHHQEAVDTAKEVIARGATTPEIRALVEDIVTAQEREITTMKQWYQDWYGTPYRDTGEYMPMMRELESLSGSALDKTFLTDMIIHHMGAIMMAHSVQPYIEHEQIATLTTAIVSTQAAEIAERRRLLRGL